MTEFEEFIKEIQKDYGKLDIRSKKELEILMSTIHKYIVMNPEAEKIKAIRTSITKRMSLEISTPLTIDKTGFWTLTRLRNLIIHHRKIDQELLLNFGNWMWNEFGVVFKDDPTALYNILSYVTRLDKKSLKLTNSADQIQLYFYEIYKSKEVPEKITMLKTLIPLVTSQFKAKYGSERESKK